MTEVTKTESPAYDPTRNLYQRINQVMLKVDGVIKGATIALTTGRSYKAVSHDDVTRVLHKPIAEAGIVIQTSVLSSQLDAQDKEKDYNGNKSKTKEYMATVTVEITAINMDKPEERLSVQMPAIAFDSGDKAYGKAISMATKTGLLKLFMLESYDDEESRGKTKSVMTPKNNTPADKKAPVKPSSEIGNYIVKVGKFKGQMLGDIDAKELSDYCVYMKKDDKKIDGPMKEFIDKAREYVIGAK